MIIHEPTEFQAAAKACWHGDCATLKSAVTAEATAIAASAHSYAATYLQTSSWLQIAKDAIFIFVLLHVTASAFYYLRSIGLCGSIRAAARGAASRAVQAAMSLPGIRGKVEAELARNVAKVESSVIVQDQRLKTFPALPRTGWSEPDILAELSAHAEMKHTAWENGRVSGAVYHGGDDLLDLQAAAFRTFGVANQLHPDVFPAIRKMESEVVAMTLQLYHGPPGSCGTSTSGGTESLLLACLAAKEYARQTRGVTRPEMVVPETAHAGFDKAAYYFGIKLRHAPIDPKTFQVDLKAVARLINGNTVLLAGSAPSFPHGIIDDIPGLGRLALRHGLPLHVDACLGSFVVPFLKEAGFKSPDFDFRVPGVTSISCDTHKYGFAPKGSSVIMYRSPELRRCQFYVSTEWPGGIYGSPTLAGSRPGALMAGCWATMIRVGHAGYLESCREIVGAAQKFRRTIETEIPALYILGDPVASVVSFGSDKLDVYDLTDRMAKRGWHLNALQKPAALHVAFTRPLVSAVDDLVADLKECVAESEAAAEESKRGGKSDTAVLYGVAGSVQAGHLVPKLVEGFLGAMYKYVDNEGEKEEKAE